MMFFKNIKLDIPFPVQLFPIDEATQKKRDRSIIRIKERAEERFKKEEFYTPIHYYTCNKFYKAVNESLRNIGFNDFEIFKSKEMLFVGALIKSLFLIPNFIGIVHRGISHLRFSSHQKEGDLFYWKGFTSTSLKP